MWNVIQNLNERTQSTKIIQRIGEVEMNGIDNIGSQMIVQSQNAIDNNKIEDVEIISANKPCEPRNNSSIPEINFNEKQREARLVSAMIDQMESTSSSAPKINAKQTKRSVTFAFDINETMKSNAESKINKDKTQSKHSDDTRASQTRSLRKRRLTIDQLDHGELLFFSFSSN